MNLRILKISKLLKSSSSANYTIRSWDDLGKAFDAQVQQDIQDKWKEYIEYGQGEALNEGDGFIFNRTDDIKSFLEFFNSRGLEKVDTSLRNIEVELLKEIKAIVLEAQKRKITSNPKATTPTRSEEAVKSDGRFSKSPENAKRVWTKSDLGRVTGGGINFHEMKDGKNNYRAGLKPKYTLLSLDFFKSLKDNFGIKRIISLNGSSEWEGADLPKLITEAGMQHAHIPMGTVPTRQEFDKIVALLKEGNNLIHCAHGADRTGSVVGRYYLEELGWPMDQVEKETKKYGGHKYEDNIKFITESKFKQSKRDRMKVYNPNEEKRARLILNYFKYVSLNN